MTPDLKAMQKALWVAKRVAQHVDPGFAHVPLPVPGRPIPLQHAAGGRVGKAGGGGMGDNGGPPMGRSLTRQGLYSHAAEAARALPQAKGTGQQMLASLKGVKPDELKWSGAQEKFAARPSVTRDELAAHFERNVPKLTEAVHHEEEPSQENGWRTTGGGARYGEYTLGGGDNYRELLMRFPRVNRDTLIPDDEAVAKHQHEWDALDDHAGEDAARLTGLMADDTMSRIPKYMKGDDYTHRHWMEGNVAAHLRLKDRPLPDGGKALHMEELQSDWGQDARKKGITDPAAEEAYRAAEERAEKARRAKIETRQNFRDQIELHGQHHPNVDEAERAHDEALAEHYRAQAALHPLLADKRGVPDAPYIDNTEKWTDLGLKRALYEAAKGGYDKLVWTPGDEQANRYELSKQVSTISAEPAKLKPGHLHVRVYGPDDSYDEGERLIHSSVMHPDKLEETFGKDIAQKIMERVKFPEATDRHEVFNTASGHRGSKHDTREEAEQAIRSYPESIQPDLAVRPFTGESHGEGTRLTGLDLQHGGEGMRGFYDKIVPKRLMSLIKEHDPEARLGYHYISVEPQGATMGDIARHSGYAHPRDIPPHLYDEVSSKYFNDHRQAQLPGVDITPRMRDSILQNGFKAYRRGGEVERTGKAGGGSLGDEMAANGNTSQHVAAPEHEVSTQSLAHAFNTAIAHHVGLPIHQRALNSRAVAERIKPFVGTDPGTGRPKPLLTSNAKLVKAKQGYEAGMGYEGQEPILMPDGRGVETVGLPLSPAAKAGKFKVCPNSKSCEDVCLGKTSGNYGASYAVNWPRINSARKTNAMLHDPEAFAVRLHDEITQAKMQAGMEGNKLAVRLNTLSDLDPKVHEALIKSHPDVDFYDYTKMAYKPIAANHHYTYSSTGLTQPPGYNGIEEGEGVHNPHQNWRKMRNHLDNGSNVAMVFSHPDHLPHEVHDEETGRRYKVVDGTTHDYRPLDAQPPGSPGVVVGLRNLSTKGKRDRAHIDSQGFIVRHDPQLMPEINERTGKPTGKPLRGPSPGKKANGTAYPGPTYPQNHVVTIPTQPDRRFEVTRSGRKDDE